VSIEQFRQASARGQLIPGSSGSGDSQDPDDNRGPPRKQLPGDKIGGSSGDDNDDDEEKKKKKRKKDDDSDHQTVLVRVAEVAVRNINQVSTLIFFPPSFHQTRLASQLERQDPRLTLLFRLAGWLAGLVKGRRKKKLKTLQSGSRRALDETDLGDCGQLRQCQQQPLSSEFAGRVET